MIDCKRLSESKTGVDDPRLQRPGFAFARYARYGSGGREHDVRAWRVAAGPALTCVSECPPRSRRHTVSL